jgi:mycofactocin precursor
MSEPALDTAEPTTTNYEGEDEDKELVDEEMLVEDVSIDGMCGVY